MVDPQTGQLRVSDIDAGAVVVFNGNNRVKSVGTTGTLRSSGLVFQSVTGRLITPSWKPQVRMIPFGTQQQEAHAEEWRFTGTFKFYGQANQSSGGVMNFGGVRIEFQDTTPSDPADDPELTTSSQILFTGTGGQYHHWTRRVLHHLRDCL